MNFNKTKSSIKLLLATFLILGCSQNAKIEGEVITPKKIEFSTPESVGFSRDSLMKIDQMVEGYVKKGFIPGAVVLVARHGKIAYEKAIGWNNIDKKKSLLKNNQFRLASMTKPITSVAIMQLSEQGKLNLDDPVSKFIPEFKSPRVMTKFNETDTTWESRPANREITIKHLLTHTSGIPYGFMSPNEMGAIYAKNQVPDGANHLNTTLENKMATLGKLPILFDPGEKWNYGLSTDVLGRVVEVVSSMNLDSYTKEFITKPLGMNNTAYFFSDTSTHNIASLYLPLGDTAITEAKHQEGLSSSPDFPFRGAKKYLSGGSGLTGTAKDYFIFCQTLLNGGKWGKTEILNESTVKSMMSNQIDTVSYTWGAGKFGYGFHVLTENGSDSRSQRAGRSSWGGIFHTTFWIDPSRDIVAIMMSQVLSNPNKGKIDATFETFVNNALVDESI